MHSYLPHTPNDRAAMLKKIGAAKADDFFDDIPRHLRLQRELKLPKPLSELELTQLMRELAQKNSSFLENACFLGAGAYDHFIPSVIDHVLRRSEFYTAYTQYQAEIAQGYLQALFEYQSMICALTGMAVANASMYDGATAGAEAAMLACHATRRHKIIVASTVHPNYRQVASTYGIDSGFVLETAGSSNGCLDPEQLEAMLDQDTAAIYLQSPNFFGCLENIAAAAGLAHAKGALLIVCADPIALGMLEAPGKLGADIVVGEGQSLGLSVSFGGPGIGFMAVTEKLMRKLPGRIIGQTDDVHGQRGFVLTLQAREQHIRREKATSNICSNEALCALACAVYLTALGKTGLPQVADLCLQKAHYLQEKLCSLPNCSIAFTAPFFNEFVVKLKQPVSQLNEQLLQKKIIGGLDLAPHYPELADCMLLCVTEKRSKEEIDHLVTQMEVLL